MKSPASLSKSSRTRSHSSRKKRQEVTTEGGLDVIGNTSRLKNCIHQFLEAGIEVSLFIDPDPRQIEASRSLGVQAVELHTGRYADAHSPTEQRQELQALQDSGKFARELGLLLHMGHGLTYRNVLPIARIPGIGELNIGHSIISRAVLVGMEQAVREMKRLITT